jgi:hypothetical protein
MTFEAGETVVVMAGSVLSPSYLQGESGMILEVSQSSDYVPEHYTIKFEKETHILYGSELRREDNARDVTYELTV